MTKTYQIGLTCRLTDQTYSVKETYIQAIESTGSKVVLLAPQSEYSLALIIDQLDGVVILGGYDVDSTLYNEVQRACVGVDAIIDALDILVIRLAMEKHKPILGICRGLQIINVALGGSLYQDLNNDFSNQIDHNYSAKHDSPLIGHSVNIIKTSFLYPIFSETLLVNSYHHQGIKELAPFLTATAYSLDGLIEAVEASGIVAVQWHPERMLSQTSTLNFFKTWVESLIK